MVALNPRPTALTRFQAGHLFGFPMYFLNSPAHGTHLLCLVRRVLRYVVGGDVIRARRSKAQAGISAGDVLPESLLSVPLGRVVWPGYPILNCRRVGNDSANRLPHPLVGCP